MTKTEALDALKAQDIECEIDKGILWLYGISMRTAKRLLKQIGYNSTFGVRKEKVQHD